MTAVAQPLPDVSPSVIAALLLAATSELRRLALPHPTTDALLAATGAGRSHAYALKDRLLALLPELSRPVGRPAASAPAVSSNAAATISQQVLRFVADHPGAIDGGRVRRSYSDAFRCFVLERCEQHRELELSVIAEAVCVPLGTLRDWLRGGRAQINARSSQPAESSATTTARIETLLAAWQRWDGSFIAFCDHIQHHLRIPYGRTLIASILEQHGVRIPRRRPGRSPDEKALRKAFETFFPGAQWEGDGSPIDVTINGQRFRFNLELMVDVDTDASVGASTRDEEDSAAVVEAFDDGVQTTGVPPLCLLVDNRPSNHTDEVAEGIGTTMRMRATTGRPQNKAHVEGAFGLFSQVVPVLAISATSPKEIARQLLQIVAKTWARTLNHRPRADRGGRSRVELYQDDSPTAEQVEQARALLAERCRKQEQARKTLQARTDPVVRKLLDDAFERLQLQDPEGNIRSAIARYPIDAVIAGIATFEGKREKQTLPLGVDGRYLLGIVRNIAFEDEGIQISEALLRERLAAQDLILQGLQHARDAIARSAVEPLELLKSLLDRALATDRRLDRLFWLQTAADHVRHQPLSQHTPLLRVAARRIHATYAATYGDRLAAARFLAANVLPLV